MTTNTNSPVYPGQGQPTRNSLLPTDGPLSVPVSVDFSVNPTQTIDFQQLMVQRKITMVQSVYVDNSANSDPVKITVVGGTNQTLEVPPQSQAYLPVVAPVPVVFQVASSGGVVVNFLFNNFPTPAIVWNVVQTNFQFTGSALIVSDETLDNQVVTNGLQTVPNLQLTGGAAMPEMAGDICYTGSVSAAGPTNIIAAPGAGLAFFIKSINLQIAGDAAISGGAATITVTIKDGTTPIFTTRVYVPASAANGPTQTLLNLNDLNLPSLALNNALTITLSTALTGGDITYNVVGGTSTYVAG